MKSQETLKKAALARHKKLRGKIAVTSKDSLQSLEALRLYYTPGVGAVSSFLQQHPNETKNYTIKANSVAVISDGSAVLGLGNIGAAGAIPVMEGKAMIFKEFAGVDAFPIVLNTQDTDDIVRTIQNIAPVFGAINLEDIAAPRCFDIEKRLQDTLDIFVMHDDQHATSIVVLAGLINACKVARKQLQKSRVVIVGAGAAGATVAHLLHAYGVGDILVVDTKGIVSSSRTDLEPYKQELARYTNPRGISGTMETAVTGADIFIGLSVGGILKAQHVRSMAADPIVFALANPVPEIMPDEALKAGASVVATGRSDFANQINNALAFPGLFKGVLQYGVRKLTTQLKIRVAEQLAKLVQRPTHLNIIPSLLDKRVVKTVAAAVEKNTKTR